jgi:hypothetical protein
MVFHHAAQQLKTIMRSKSLWTTLLFVALFHFSPGFIGNAWTLASKRLWQLVANL